MLNHCQKNLIDLSFYRLQQPDLLNFSFTRPQPVNFKHRWLTARRQPDPFLVISAYQLGFNR